MIAIDIFGISDFGFRILEVKAFADDGVDREHDLASLKALLGVIELIVLAEGAADIDAVDSFLKGVGHTATDEDLIAFLQERVDDLDLRGDFGTA